MEKKPAMMDVMMMAIFLDSSSRYSLSRSFSSSISSSSSSSSSDSLSELSSSGSSMLSSLGLSILYWKRGSFDFVSFYSLFVMFALLLPFLVVFDELPPALLLVSLKSWTLSFEMTFCFFHFTNLCLDTIIFLWHLYFSFLSSFVSPASLLLLSSSPENPVNV